jgi:hypothetical protein
MFTFIVQEAGRLSTLCPIRGDGRLSIICCEAGCALRLRYWANLELCYRGHIPAKCLAQI